MPTFMVTDPTTGQKLKLTGDSAPTEQELNDIFGQQQQQQPDDNAPMQDWKAYYKATVKPKAPSLLESEFASPIRSALSTAFTAGLLKEGIGALSPEVKSRMFPEQVTIPGKILRGAAELRATLFGLPAKIVTKGIDFAASKAPQAILPAAKMFSGTMRQKINTGALAGGIGGLSLAAENLNPIEQLKQVGFGVLTGGSLPVVAQRAKNVFTSVINKFPRLQTDTQLAMNVSKKIQEGVWKAFRPAQKGKTTVSGMDKFDSRAEEAITDIIANKENNVFIDDEGLVKGNKLPESLKDTAMAVNEGRKRIFQEYNAMSTQAGEDGAIISVNNLDNVLAKYDTDLLATENPALSNYVKRQRAGLALRKRFTPLEAENKIAEFNADLKGTNVSPDFGRETRKSVMQDMAESLRKDLDESIMSATGNANYQSLKNKYGAYKTLSDEIGKRLPVVRRSSPSGFFDLADAFASGDIVSGVAGVAVGDPSAPARILRGLGINVGKTLIKRRNNPDVIVSNMFKDVDRLLSEKGRRTLERTEVIPSRSGSIKPQERSNVSEAKYPQPEQIGMERKIGLPNLSAEKQGYKSGSGTIIPYANRRVPSTGAGSETINIIEGSLKKLGYSPAEMKGIKEGEVITGKGFSVTPYSTKEKMDIARKAARRIVSERKSIPVTREMQEGVLLGGKKVEIPIKKNELPIKHNTPIVKKESKRRTPILSNKNLKEILPIGQKKPQDFKTAEEYVASKKAGILNTEDLELNPDKAKKQNIVGAAFIQDGKIYGDKYAEGAMNHSDIAEKYKLDYNKAIPGFIDKDGNFLYQYEEDLPVDKLTTEWQAAQKNPEVKKQATKILKRTDKEKLDVIQSKSSTGAYVKEPNATGETGTGRGNKRGTIIPRKAGEATGEGIASEDVKKNVIKGVAGAGILSVGSLSDANASVLSDSIDSTKKHEKYMPKMYVVKGELFPTIGYGHRIEDKNKYRKLASSLGIKDAFNLSKEDAEKLFYHDFSIRRKEIEKLYPSSKKSLIDVMANKKFQYSTKGFEKNFGNSLRNNDINGLIKDLKNEAERKNKAGYGGFLVRNNDIISQLNKLKTTIK